MDNVRTVMIYDRGLDRARKLLLKEIYENIESIESIMFGSSIQINGSIKILYTNKDNPYTYSEEGLFVPKNCLHIDEDYYLENKDEVNTLTSFIASKKTKKIKILETPLITNELIDAMVSNTNLEEVTLGNSNDPFTLDVEMYDKFKNSNIKKINTHNVVEELKNVFDGLVGYNYDIKQINYLSLYDLNKEKQLSFYSPLSQEEVENLKYVNDACEINISIDDVQNVFTIIKKIKEYNKKNPIKIGIKNKNKNDFNKLLFNNLDDLLKMNITVAAHLTTLDIKTYVSYESRLLKMVEPALRLSPFEKYLYAYNVVKRFKKYKENKDNTWDSRDFYEVLDNEYMVCVGFSNLLGDLLDKLGIPNKDYNVDVDITFDNVPLDTHVVTEEMLKSFENGGHARRQVHLVDPKYNIDGIFIADPTWDNDMEHDTYNYALMTPDEYNGIKRYNYLEWYTTNEMFFVHNIEEFYEKANLWMNENISRNKEKYPEGAFIKKITSDIELLDPVFYQNLCVKYPKISSGFSKYTKEELSDIMLELGDYIVSKVNKPVTGLQFRDAIKVIYEKCYGITDNTELNKKIEEIMEYNKREQDKNFPLRYKQDLEGNDIPYMNITNKFDIETIENEYGRTI